MFFGVILQISRSHGLKNQWFESNLSKITRPVAAIKSLRFALFHMISYFSSILLTSNKWWFNIRWYCMQHNNNNTSRILPSFSIHKRHSTPHPHMWAMGCFVWPVHKKWQWYCSNVLYICICWMLCVCLVTMHYVLIQNIELNRTYFPETFAQH